MHIAADRMRALGQVPSDSGAPTSIFGSAAGLAQSIHTEEQYRIGVYPIVCAKMPEVAMGLASCLCYLLEQYRDTRVYRCFAKIDDADENAEITESDYQFSPADWTLEGLADNVILEGALNFTEGGFELLIQIDNSLSSDEVEGVDLSYEAKSLADVVSTLPAIAADIYGEIAGQINTKAIIEYDPFDNVATVAERLLESVFGWNLDVYLYLWDVKWDRADVHDQYLEVVELCDTSPSQFGFWCLGMMAKQVMQPGLSEVGETLVPQVTGGFGDDVQSAPGVAAAALGLSTLGHALRATALLQRGIGSDAPASAWCAMIDIYLDSGQLAEAIDTAQRALEDGLQHPALYWRYAELLMAAEVNGLNVEDVLLLDPDEYDDEDHITVEIANSLKLYTDSRGDDLGALQLALLYMIDAADDELWSYFESLLQRDEEGVFSGEVVDRLIELDVHDRAYDVLESQLDSNAYAFVYLAQLALADSDTSLALEMVRACRDSLAEIDDGLEFELQRIGLRASLPSFDEQYAEIRVILNANRQVSENNVELLEEAIEHAPKLVDLHLLLSACYRSWRDNDSALEVLREAEQQAGPDPQIDLGIAQILWTRNEHDNAVSILNSALERFPNDVNLLAQLATYLIENGQYEDARQYVSLAETIAPSHRAIWQVRRLIAQKMTR